MYKNQIIYQNYNEVNNMNKRKLKWFVKPILYGTTLSILLLSIALLNFKEKNMNDFKDFVFVNKSIIKDALPVLKEDDIIIKPFQSDNINIYKKFYDKDSSLEEKIKSIIYYKDTYIQNSGIIYSSDKEFDVVSILDGKVTNIKEDKTLGNVVEITYMNNLIANYSGLKDIKVKEGQNINQNEIIGKSSKINIDQDLNNSLLFEIIKDGKYQNPELFFDKKINEL
jgi:stage II sporulation protein Q